LIPINSDFINPFSFLKGLLTTNWLGGISLEGIKASLKEDGRLYDSRVKRGPITEKLIASCGYYSE
jgi:hypothetical protein